MNKRFISFEGGEGVGKTTLIAALKKSLSALGYEVITTREPGSTAVAEKIRLLLLSKDSCVDFSLRTELFLLLAARADHVEKVIKPALLSGKIVLCDRFNDSTVAYQGQSHEVSEQQIEQLCSFCTKDLEPSLTFLLDAPAEIGFSRLSGRKMGMDRMEQKSLEFHQLVREAFLTSAKRHPSRIQIVDATLPKNSVFEKVLNFLVEHLNSACK